MTDLDPAHPAGLPGGDLRPPVAPPDLADPTLVEDDRPVPWDWADQTASDAVELGQALVEFVRYLNGRYAWNAEHTIPPCWARHGALIEELTTLMWSRWAAFQGPLASPDAAQTWHTSHLPLALQRVTYWLGPGNALDCRNGRHQPCRLHAQAQPTVADAHQWASVK